MGVRGVDQIYSGIQRRVHDFDALLLVGIAIGTEHHGSESVCAYADAGSSERAIFHGFLLRSLRLAIVHARGVCTNHRLASTRLLDSRRASCYAAARSVCVCAERSGHIAAVSLAACITKLAF